MAESLADRAVQVLGVVSGIETNNDQPERHTVRSLKNAAQAILDSAFQQAMHIALLAEQIQRDDRDAEAAAVRAAAAIGKGAGG